ncbi:uncharacterized protein DSM5745_05543 [Aspergillus mulundensis]|uniref:Uncharacterized protein n=1 Tax=Aspergillus mulundensis TaxID=1810919 RepID=A0A3D8RXY7_9EURO|nr:hypothetical protein DSM5745_05543 [Aspergillus mulundensis]RDW78691.1 hypothetical protein DSM5745_05543 [Aspergillus mulundensis]
MAFEQWQICLTQFITYFCGAESPLDIELSCQGISMHSESNADVFEAPKPTSSLQLPRSKPKNSSLGEQDSTRSPGSSILLRTEPHLSAGDRIPKFGSSREASLGTEYKGLIRDNQGMDDLF